MVAVFLALGMGIVIGTGLADHGGWLEEQRGVIDSLERQLVRMRQEQFLAMERMREAEEAAAAWEREAERLLGAWGSGRLAGLRVLIAADSASEEAAARLAAQIQQAGASVVRVGDGPERGGAVDSEDGAAPPGPWADAVVMVCADRCESEGALPEAVAEGAAGVLAFAGKDQGPGSPAAARSWPVFQQIDHPFGRLALLFHLEELLRASAVDRP